MAHTTNIERGLLHPDIINDQRGVVCLQSNATATRPHKGSLHVDMINMLGRGDIYSERRPIAKSCSLAHFDDQPEMGTYQLVTGKGADKRIAQLFMCGQYNMGNGSIRYYQHPRYLKNCKLLDTPQQRYMAFLQCLLRMAKDEALLSNYDTFYFPRFIGCAVAGGKWSLYQTALDQFAAMVKDRARVEIVAKKGK